MDAVSGFILYPGVTQLMVSEASSRSLHLRSCIWDVVCPSLY